MGRPSQVRVTGPLAEYAVGFRQELARRGYTPNSAGNQLQLMAHTSRWLGSAGLGAAELGPARVEEFLAHRREAGYTLWLSAKAMVPMLGYLCGLGVVPTPATVGPATKAEELQERYRAYLVHERALAAATVVSYLHVARLFLSSRAIDSELCLEASVRQR
jgi:integrase/recombinase XerD